MERALKESLALSYRADFCVGFFNLRGWHIIDDCIDKFEGGEGKNVACLDVFNFLKKGTQPIIKVPARGKYKQITPEEQCMVEDGRLLFFPDDITRQTKETCLKRNECIAQIADEVHIAYATPHGQLDKLKFSTK